MRFVKLTDWADGEPVYVTAEHVDGVQTCGQPEGYGNMSHWRHTAAGLVVEDEFVPLPEGAPECPTEVCTPGADYLVRESPGQVCELIEAALRPSAVR